jgi:NADPH:quinone reductase-like Zn-dependent oxidoreductase
MRSIAAGVNLQSNQRNSMPHAYIADWRTRKMAKAVRFYETGGPEVLRYEDVEVGDPGPGQVRLRHVAVGLNYADTYFRNGTYPIPMPNGMGVEASGVVQAVGEGVTNVEVGDRVTYTGFLNTLGAYSTERLIAAAPLIKLPETISFETAAAMTMRGLTSSYLMRRIYDFKAGDTILLHAAAGGVGLIVSQWAKLLGLNVIGTVSTEQKAEIARAHGCDHTINYSHEDVAARVREMTDGVGVNVVFDSVGKNTFMGSLDSLKPRGLLVCVGTASGPIPAFDPVMLAMKGSLFLTRPALANYISDPAEKAELAGELFDHVGSGRIKIEINQHYALQDAVQAHRDLESRKTTGSSIFVV